MKKESFEIAGWLGELYPGCGANLCRLRHLEAGAEILRPPHDEAAFLRQPEIYGFPVLFPPNRIDGGVFTFEGREYRFPLNEPVRGNHLHGFLLRAEWSFRRENDSVVCEHHHEADACWPHDFRAELRYDFEPDRVTQIFRIRNESNTRMPFMLGFHSSFVFPESAELFLTTADTFIPLSDDRKLPYFPEQPIDPALRHALTHPQGIPVSLHTRTAACDGFRGMRMKRDDISFTYRIDDQFGYWMFWNRTGNEGFFCAEPQTCLVDAANSDAKGYNAGLRFLEPRGEAVLSSVIAVG